jgi:hypothetical protein
VARGPEEVCKSGEVGAENAVNFRETGLSLWVIVVVVISELALVVS